MIAPGLRDVLLTGKIKETVKLRLDKNKLPVCDAIVVVRLRPGASRLHGCHQGGVRSVRADRCTRKAKAW